MSLLQEGGFRLTTWICNSREVLQSLDEGERAKDVKCLDLNNEALPTERALDISWDVERDCFHFRIQIPNTSLTKRGIPNVASSIYDPLGFLNPFTQRVKLIIRDLARLKIGWDDPLPMQQMDQWIDWVGSLLQLEAAAVPRCYKAQLSTSNLQSELHHFSDASELAYGVMSYLPLTDKDGTVHCSSVMSKSRLAPIKTMTIPRLELLATALVVKIYGVIRYELDLCLNICILDRWYYSFDLHSQCQ